MKTDHPPSGLLRGLDLLIDADWTPEQARAVIELLDDLRERIWAHYELALFEHYRQDRLTQAELPFDDPSFCSSPAPQHNEGRRARPSCRLRRRRRPLDDAV